MKKTITQKDLLALFPLTPSELHAQADLIITQTSAVLEKIKEVEHTQRSFETIIRPFDKAVSTFTSTLNSAYTLTMVSPDQKLIATAQELVSTLDAWLIEHVDQNKQLYMLFKEYAFENMPHEKLEAEEVFYVHELLKSMRKAGLELDQENQKKVAELKKELSELELLFSTRINSDQRSISVSETELAGLPESSIKELKKENGLSIVGTDTPTYTLVMEQCIIEATRKALFLAYTNRAYPENSVTLEEIRKKRHELACLLGYSSYAAYEIDDSMARTVATVEKFLDTVGNAVTIKALEEIDFLKKHMPADIALTSNGKIKPWDSAFVKAYVKKKQLAIDEQELSAYFALERTVSQLLALYEQFFSITLKEVSLQGFWHQDVRVIELYKADQLKGYLLLDLHPRPYKYTHACEIDIIKAHATQTAVIVVLANFPKGSSAEPSLLKYNDVVTFFHEFGHAIHDLLSNTQMIGFAGTEVKRDFVEMPSQMLEEWMWQPSIIKRISAHYKTDEPLTDIQIEPILALHRFCKADFTERQLSLAWLSLRCFTEHEQHKSTYEIKKEVYAQLRKSLEFEQEDHFEASFGHLTGYGARYYGYLWSQVYAKDMFAFIQEHNGLLSAEIGKRYEEMVLAPGGSKEPAELIAAFLGREPSTKAFFKSLA